MTTSIGRAGLVDASVDLLVLGGGITGAAIAYDAASRGMTVALVEKGDLGGATSAATGKMIHGGLRYLKSFEIALVHESLQERRHLSNIAGPYVYPLPMLLPRAGLLERVGLAAYDTLALSWNRPWDPDKRLPWHRWVHGEEAAERCLPGTEHALMYYDCLMPDPERLTLAFARSAVAHGAAVRTYTEAESLVVEGADVVGARLVDLESGERATVRAAVTVNATGPWSFDLVHRSFPSSVPRPSARSEGIYLLTRQLTADVTAFMGEFGHFSLAPWRGHTMIGPTETAYEGAVDDWRVTRASIDRFLGVINATAGLAEPLKIDDVRYAWGGLRPLTEETASTYESSRAAEVIDHAGDGIGGVVTAAGGKYTTSRVFASHVVDRAARKAGMRIPRSRTHLVPLDACDVGSTERFVAAIRDAPAPVAPETGEWLARHYGTDAAAVLASAEGRPELLEPLDADGEIAAQAVFAARHESARHLTDVMLRRTGIATIGTPADAVLERVAGLVAAELGWDSSRTDAEVEAVVAATAVPRR